MKSNTISKHLAILIAILSSLMTLPASAQKIVRPKPGAAGEWKLIGTTHAKHAADHDEIVVKGPFDNFRRIKFKVTDAPLKLHRMVVTYDNGAPDKIDVRENIAKGGESRVIDLKGLGKRSIRKIEFWYETKGKGDGKSDVTVVGMK